MELAGVESVLVPALKFIMLGVMAGGAIAVFRELIPMARGRVLHSGEPAEKEQS